MTMIIHQQLPDIDYETEFPITSVTRGDLTGGILHFSNAQIAALTDRDMRQIASKMADDYLEHLYWEHLEYFVREKLRAMGLSAYQQGDEDSPERMEEEW